MCLCLNCKRQDLQGIIGLPPCDLVHKTVQFVLALSYFYVSKATPIYLLVLRAQEVGNEPFWNKKKKLKNVTF